MHPNGYDPERRAEQRAARRSRRRAQFAETCRIRQAVTDMCLLTPARPLPRGHARGGSPGSDMPDAHTADLAAADAQRSVPRHAERTADHRGRVGVPSPTPIAEPASEEGTTI